MITKKFTSGSDRGTVKHTSSSVIKEAIFQRVVDWFCDQGIFDKDSVLQSNLDKETQKLCCDLLEWLEFEVKWED